MPYIKKERRPLFDQAVDVIVENLGRTDGPVTGVWPPVIDENQAKGDLNYVISSIVKRYIDIHGIKYHRINDFSGGVLSCVQMELYRRIASDYENLAIQKNGDI